MPATKRPEADPTVTRPANLPGGPPPPAAPLTQEPVPGGFVTRLRKWPKPVTPDAADPGRPNPGPVPAPEGDA